MSDNANPGVQAEPDFGFGGFLLRLLMALIVVLLTYNPSGFSFFHWARDAFLGSSLGPLHALAGLLLLGGWILFMRATTQSLGLLGVVLVGAVFAVLVWMLFFYDVVQQSSASLLIWIALVGVAVVLTFGMSWAHIRRRLSGQATVDEVRN
jgi:4-amino-4-deoxy-L-arabinose transferase-like glycosyltransferase